MESRPDIEDDAASPSRDAEPYRGDDAALRDPKPREAGSRGAYGVSAVIGLVVILGLCVVANVLAESLYFRVDLTEDQINTLSPQTEAILLGEVEDICTIRFGYDTKAPPQFVRLIRPIKTRLESIRQLSRKNDKIKVEFVDLTVPDISDEARTKDVAERVKQYQIPQQQVEMISAGEVSAKMLAFGVSVEYGSKIAQISFNNAVSRSADDEKKTEQKAVGLERFEYDLASAIISVRYHEKPKLIWYVANKDYETVPFTQVEILRGFFHSVGRFYDVVQSTALHDEKALHDEHAKLLVVLWPKDVGEREVYEIDQFLMRGGTVVLIGSPMEMDRSSDNRNMRFSFSKKTTGVEALLAHYGVKMHADMVLESLENSEAIPVMRFDERTGQLIVDPVRCRFYTKLDQRYLAPNHPATAFLGGAKAYFLSTLETLKDAQAGTLEKLPPDSATEWKTIVDNQINVIDLARSSEQSWTKQGDSIQLDLFEIAREKPDPSTQGSHPLVQLLHGRFESFFKNRDIPPKPEKKAPDMPGMPDFGGGGGSYRDEQDGSGGGYGDDQDGLPNAQDDEAGGAPETPEEPAPTDSPAPKPAPESAPVPGLFPTTPPAPQAPTPDDGEPVKKTHSEPATLVVFAGEHGYLVDDGGRRLVQNVIEVTIDDRLARIQTKEQRLRGLHYNKKEDWSYEYLSFLGLPFVLVLVGLSSLLWRRQRKARFLETLGRF